MKVIDLLNRIANGEEVPKKIKYDTMNYVFRHYDYKEVRSELIDEQSSWLEKIDFYKLNDEVEIIEEDKKIERLNNIIKEVREYIEKNTKEGPIQDKRYFYSPEQANDILEILEGDDDLLIK